MPSDEILERNLLFGETSFIATLSFEQAYRHFSSLIDELDPDDSLYRRANVLDYAKTIVNKTRTLSEYIKDDVARFILESPWTTLFTKYDHYIHRFYKVDISEKGE